MKYAILILLSLALTVKAGDMLIDKQLTNGVLILTFKKTDINKSIIYRETYIATDKEVVLDKKEKAEYTPPTVVKEVIDFSKTTPYVESNKVVKDIKSK